MDTCAIISLYLKVGEFYLKLANWVLLSANALAI